MTVATAERIAQRLDELTKQRAAIPDPGALPVTTTRDEAAAMAEQRLTLDRRIADIRNAVSTLAALPTTDADVEWRDRLNHWRDTLCAELVDTPRIRDRAEIGRQQNLTLSIRTVDHGVGVIEASGYDLTTLRLGQLMRADGFEPVGADPLRNFVGMMPWAGSLKDVERRIISVEKRRAVAEARLAAALLDDATREQLAAENKARRDALNALPTRKRRGDGSEYDRFPDGRVIEVTS